MPKRLQLLSPSERKRRAPKHPATGSRNGTWNAAGFRIDDQGYVRVRVGHGHPLELSGSGFAYAHHVVWVSAGNPKPGPGELLHHRDEDKTHNALGNLELQTFSEHGRHHAAQRRRRAMRRAS